MRLHPFFLALLLLAFLALPAQAQNIPRDPLLTPIGGGDGEIPPELIDAAILNARQGKVHILILPINLASDSLSISADERNEILESMETLRQQIEASFAGEWRRRHCCAR